MNADQQTIELHRRIAGLVDFVRDDRETSAAIREAIDDQRRRRTMAKATFGLRKVPWTTYFLEEAKND